MTWLRALLVALVALCALCAVGEASAHASLIAATPGDGAALREAPAEVVLSFDESVAPLVLRLIDDQGAAVPLGDTRAEGMELRVRLPALRRGAFVFSYRVASADSHPVAGSIAFTVGEGLRGSGAAAASASASASGVDFMAVAARIVRDLLLLVASGTALFAVLVGVFPHQRAVLWGAAGGAVAATVIELGLQAAALAGPGASMHAALDAAVSTTAGRSAAGICLGAAATALGAWMSRPAARHALLLAGAIATAASVALTGHAAAAQHPWVSMPVVACHVLVAAFWLGSLVALRLSLSTGTNTRTAPDGCHPGLDPGSLATPTARTLHRHPGFARALRKFSAIAIPAVAALVAAGIAFAAMQLDSPRDLLESPYGMLVLAKLAGLLALLAIAMCNRFVMMPRLERGDAHAMPWLRRAITAELVLIALVLTVTSVLSRTPPPSHQHAAQAQLTRELVAATPTSLKGSLTLSPGRAGHNRVVVTLRDAAGRPLTAEGVMLVLSHPQSGIEPIERPLDRDAAGTWWHEGAEMAFPGIWRLSVEGRIGDFERFRLQADAEIR